MKDKQPRMKNTKKFFSDILLSTNPASSKRFVTLIAMAHFFLASFVILFIVIYLIFYLPKGRVDPDLLSLLKEILEYDFYIILSGLGFVTVEGVTNIIVERAKAKAQALTSIITGASQESQPDTKKADEEVRDI